MIVIYMAVVRPRECANVNKECVLARDILFCPSLLSSASPIPSSRTLPTQIVIRNTEKKGEGHYEVPD